MSLFAKDESRWPGTALVVREVVPVARVEEEDLLLLAARAAWPENHPIHIALRRTAAQRGIALPPPDPQSDWEWVDGQGLLRQGERARLLVGNERLVEDAGIDLSPAADTILQCHERENWISLLIGADNQAEDPDDARCSLLGILGLGEAEPADEEPATDGRDQPAEHPDEIVQEDRSRAVTSGLPSSVEKGDEGTRIVRSPVAVPATKRSRTRRWVAALVTLSALAGVINSLVLIKPDEVGVVRRFGRIVGVWPAGMYLSAWPLDRVTRLKPDELRVLRVTASARAPASRDAAGVRDSGTRSLALNPTIEPALTGDLWSAEEPLADRRRSVAGLVLFDAALQYNISDPIRCQLNRDLTEDLLKRLVESVIREQIGRRNLDGLLTGNRADLGEACLRALQAITAPLDLGLSFRELIVTRIEADTDPDTSGADVSAVMSALRRTRMEEAVTLARARGDAEQLLRDAEVQAAERVAAATHAGAESVRTARDKAERVRPIVEEFRRDPRATRRRLVGDLIGRKTGAGGIVIFDSADGRIQALRATTSQPASRPADKGGRR